jgi:hypothetical protein
VNVNWQKKAQQFVMTSSQDWFSDHRGIAAWDDIGTPRCVAYGNDGYATDVRSQVEVGVLRKYLGEIGVKELGFAVCPDGYGWLMIIGADHSKVTVDLLQRAWMGATFKVRFQGSQATVDELVEEIWAEVLAGVEAEPAVG